MNILPREAESDWRERGLLAPVPILATGSALRLHPCRALSSAQSAHTIGERHINVNAQLRSASESSGFAARDRSYDR